jgi:glycyl-tRNA synthetase beta chain
MATDLLHSFLVEIGTEELPPTALRTLSDAFVRGVEQGLATAKVSFASSQGYASPRRLAMTIEGLPSHTPLEDLTIWGPPAKIAFDDKGQPSKAALGFASKNGLKPEELKVENDGKIDKLVYHSKAGGVATQTLLADVVDQALASLPIAKRMRWGASRAEFVRPIHWVVMLFDDAVIEAEILGVPTGRTTRGHRFHHNRPIDLRNSGDYVAKLRDGYVIASFEERQSSIREQVTAAGRQLGGDAIIDDDLLDEVTALVEWPVALAGNFDPSFLEVPAEALISSMKEHQKYFHVVKSHAADKKGALMPHFITLCNIESTDPAQVIAGNEKVIRPRLADAAFFFETDKKTSLDQQRERLRSVVFQAQLGTLFDKTERIAGLARTIAQAIDADTTMAERAGQLCKADLVSAMVYEFADMQGIAGYYYALNDGETAEVAAAMQEQYLPRFSGDRLPETITGSIVALADRLDTLIGIFAIGQMPTGSKDPFGLRRASLAALRILVEKQFALDLRDLLARALANYGPLPQGETAVEQTLTYMLERFKAWYEEAAIASEVFQSVSAKNLTCPLDINNRVYAVAAFCKLPEAAALAAANKRVSNILAKVEGILPNDINPSLLQEPAEKLLAQKLEAMRDRVKPLLAAQDYTGTLATLAALRAPVDTFFDDVMVMTEDPELRNNRLALLQQLRALFLEVADISHLAVKNS